MVNTGVTGIPFSGGKLHAGGFELSFFWQANYASNLTEVKLVRRVKRFRMQ